MVDESYDHSKRWWTLVGLCLSLVIVVVGNTVLNVAIPTLVRDLHASNSALQRVVAALGGGRVLLPSSDVPQADPLDPVGAGLSMAGGGAVLYGIIEGAVQGWTAPATVGPLLSGLAILAVFGFWELRAEYPMLDLRFFKQPTFSAATAAINMVFFAMFGTFFLLTQYLELVPGY